MTRQLALLMAALGVSCAGCYTTWDIPTREMAKLDGYRSPEVRVIQDENGGGELSTAIPATPSPSHPPTVSHLVASRPT